MVFHDAKRKINRRYIIWVPIFIMLWILLVSPYCLHSALNYVLHQFSGAEYITSKRMEAISLREIRTLQAIKDDSSEVLSMLNSIIAQVQNKSNDEHRFADLQHLLSANLSADHLAKQVIMQASIIDWLNSEIAAMQGHLRNDDTVAYSTDKKPRMIAKNPDQWLQNHFQGYGSYGFVKYSCYRMSPSRFMVIGLGLRSHRRHRKIGDCRWHSENGSSVSGDMLAFYPGEHHFLQYETILIECDFEYDVQSGGYLVATIDNEEIAVFKENAGAKVVALEPYPSEITVCVAPIYGKGTHFRALREFMAFHTLLGADHFVIYDATPTDYIRSNLASDVRQGVVEIIDFLHVEMFQTWYHGQMLSAHDCIHRSRFTARWVMVGDIDEYLWIAPPHTLKGILEAHNTSTGITHGALWFNIYKCRPQKERGLELHITQPDSASKSLKTVGDAFAIENFFFRWPQPICWENHKRKNPYDPRFCPRDTGHRKYIVDPRKVEIICIHGHCESGATNLDLVDMSTDIIAHAHYSKITGGIPWSSHCNETTPINSTVPWYALDTRVAQQAHDLRYGYICNFSGPGCVKAGSSS